MAASANHLLRPRHKSASPHPVNQSYEVVMGVRKGSEWSRVALSGDRKTRRNPWTFAEGSEIRTLGPSRAGVMRFCSPKRSKKALLKSVSCLRGPAGSNPGSSASERSDLNGVVVCPLCGPFEVAWPFVLKSFAGFSGWSPLLAVILFTPSARLECPRRNASRRRGARGTE